jgi:hypothetical protein
LALGTDVRASLPHGDPLNRCVTARTRLTFPAVGDEPASEISSGAVGLPEIAVRQRGAALTNGSAQRRLYRPVEHLDLSIGEAVSRAKRVNASLPERLIDVDVPQASQEALIEQKGLDSPSPLGKHVPETLDGKCVSQRLGAELLEHVTGLVGQDQPSKLAHV